MDSGMGIKESLAKQGVRMFGSPPPKGAPKVEAWMYVRRIYSRSLLFTVPIWIVLALDGGPSWQWILFGISAATWLQGFISVNLRIRRLRNLPPDG
jgi:hypothetical protein